MTPRTWALAGTAGAGLAAAFLARPISTSNRIYVSIRKAEDFEPLLILPNPLLANFCIYNDPLSKELSTTLQKVVNEGTPRPVSAVDIEADEPNVQELLSRYVVGTIPTIVALRGGYPISQFVPKRGSDEKDLESKLRAWIDKIE